MARNLSVATYNIHRAIGTDRCRDVSRIAAVIGELQADIIGLQEVDWQQSRNDWQLEYLAHLPGFHAVVGSNICDHRGSYGNLLLSRAAVRAVRRIDLTVPGREPRSAIDADLDCDGRTVRVIVTHFGLDVRERWRQSRLLRSAIESGPRDPILLLGDFNEWMPGSPSLRPLLTVCRQARQSASYPLSRPVFALDRVLVHGLPFPSGVRTHRSTLAHEASDHLPVVADIDLPW